MDGLVLHSLLRPIRRFCVTYKGCGAFRIEWHFMIFQRRWKSGPRLCDGFILLEEEYENAVKLAFETHIHRTVNWDQWLLNTRAISA